jgi:hypothetical protein
MSKTIAETIAAKLHESDVKPNNSIKQTQNKEESIKKSATDKPQESENESQKEPQKASLDTNKDNKIENNSKYNIKLEEKEKIASNKSLTDSEIASPKSLKAGERSHEVSPFSPPSPGASSVSSSPVSPMRSIQPITQIPVVPVIAPQRFITSETVFGPKPVITRCEYCGAESLTETRLQMGLTHWMSWLCACIHGCIFCCICCIATIPCLIEQFYDIRHECRNCGAVLGVYQRHC